MPTVIIDGVEYERVDTAGEKLRLVVSDNRGLTFVGRCRLDGEGDWMVIRDARCVIRWGTRLHLAELAMNGPAGNTRLGANRDVIVRRQGVVAIYDCEESTWH